MGFLPIPMEVLGDLLFFVLGSFLLRSYGRRNIKMTAISTQKKRRAMAEVSHQEHAWRM
jgi:hypothetical protein